MSIAQYSLNPQYSDGRLKGLSIGIGKSIGFPFGIFHFYTNTIAGPPPIVTVTAEELDSLQSIDLHGQVCE